jgi:hypothetical protein
MKWDAFVYARGVQRTDGFKIRVQPEGLPIEEIYQDCQYFFNFRESKDPAWREILKNDPLAWEKSFMFIIRPKYKSCVLVRAAKVTSGSSDEPLLDFMNRQIWSLEGIWCPYEKLPLMFASLPSIIMHLSDTERCLCHSLGQNGQTQIEIQDKYYYNPYEEYEGESQEIPPLPENIKMFENMTAKTAMRMLANRIKFAGEPFSFFFGPLAEVMMKGCAKRYNAQECFSTVNPASLGKLGADSFAEIKNAELAIENDKSAEKIEYILQCCLAENENKESVFRWRVAGKEDDEMKEELSGISVPYNAEKGIRFIKLKAEAEAIRQFVSSVMQWEVKQASENIYEMYRFFKEV